MFSDDTMKWAWLVSKLEGCIEEGKVLIFVSGKASTEELAKNIRTHLARRRAISVHTAGGTTATATATATGGAELVGVESLHGDRDQADRTSVMRKYDTRSDHIRSYQIRSDQIRSQ